MKLRERNNPIKVSFVGTLLTLWSMSSLAASFDCSHASLSAEQRICASTELSQLDEQLATAYKTALAKSSDPTPLKRTQRQWAQIRNGCGGESVCLKRLYEERLEELQDGDDSSIFSFVGFEGADRLWSFVSTELKMSDTLSRVARDRSMFARIGPDSFLVLMANVYLAQPTLGKLTALGKAAPSDDSWDKPSFWPLPNGGQWLFLSGNHLDYGISTQLYSAVFIKPSKEGEPVVSATDIGLFKGADGGLCAHKRRSGDPLVAQHVDSATVADINHDSMDDITLQVTEQNCTTHASATRNVVFVNTGEEFRKLGDETPTR